MSTTAPAVWYRSESSHVTGHEQIDRALDELAQGKAKLRTTPIAQLRQLAAACLEGTVAATDDWVNAACRAKGIEPHTTVGSEDVSNGVMATARYLRLIMRSLAEVEQYGVPQLPQRPLEGPDGRLRVPVMPTKGLYDALAFSGFRAQVWMQDGVTRDNLPQNMAAYYRNGRQTEGITLVLGAGNVSSIPATDAFTMIFQEGKVVLLKMNPVNEYVGPIFERAFASLIDAGFLRIIYGGAEEGAYATQHDLVDEVHITGSVHSHNTIVWGPPGPDRDRRMAENDPLLKKPISSELGNVTPWIVVPGQFTDKQLRYQAENTAVSILNNCSFNCVATKVIVTWQGWPQRDQYLDYVQQVLDAAPPRKAYYPGAEDRFRRFTGEEPQGCPAGTLPWTLKRDVNPEEDSLYFDEESFVCVTTSTSLAGSDAHDYLQRAAQFANDRLFGTLGASVLVHPSFRKDAQNAAAFERFISELRYGTIGINHWCALSYGMISPPWGGYPGATIHDPVSGIGSVHNTYMLDRPLKSVLEGPFTVFPKPVWFPTSTNADRVTRRVVRLCQKPSLGRLGSVVLASLRG